MSLSQPLPERLRPSELALFVGQSHLAERLTTLLEGPRLPSLLLFGPPGCGKSTLALLLARARGGMYEGRTGESTINELYQKTFLRDATDEEKKSIYEEKAILFNQYNDGKAMQGAAEVLKKVKASGLQTLVVTGSGQHSLINKLEHTYPGYFKREKMVTAFDVKLGKPHPEPYLMGLEKAGVKPYEALVVENAPMGIQAGVAAGIFTIAVNTGPLDDRILLDAGADLLYPDMTALAKDWDNLMNAIKIS